MKQKAIIVMLCSTLSASGLIDTITVDLGDTTDDGIKAANVTTASEHTFEQGSTITFSGSDKYVALSNNGPLIAKNPISENVSKLK